MTENDNGRFKHLRHKPPTELSQPRPLILTCPALRSNVNFSRIVRAAACCGVRKIITSGSGKVDSTIARDGADYVDISTHRSLAPVLQKMQDQGFQLVGLEQTTNSVCSYEFQFARQTVLVIGHERNGIADDILEILDDVIEIPVFGMPFSYNVATAASMALYEYCRQFPAG
jgi:tRNA G18 (ribose-2'-O)-methylase SpoU